MKLTPEGFVAVSDETLARITYMASLDEESCCSFDEWATAGYMINQGAKSMFRDITGVPQFTKEQVQPYPNRR